MKRVEDRGGTQIATKVEGGTSVFPVGSRMVPDLATSMPPTQGVTVTGPSNFNLIRSHNLAVYREGATLTPAPHGPAPPAHAAQPSSVIHQMPANAVKTETISLSPAAVSLQYSRSPNTGNSITVAAVSSPSLHNLQLAPGPPGSGAPQIVTQKAGGGPVTGPHGAPVFGGGGATTVRTVAPAPTLPSSGGGGGNPSFQRLKVEDALSYLDQVKFKFGSQPQVYNDFLDIMKEFKSQSIDTPGVISRVSTLFRGHPELIVGFNTFLPPGYKIEVQTSESQHSNLPGGHPHTLQTIVHTPHGIHMMGSQGMIGPAITTNTGGATATTLVQPPPGGPPPSHASLTGGGGPHPPPTNQIPVRGGGVPTKYQVKTEPSSIGGATVLPATAVVTVPAAPRSSSNSVENSTAAAIFAATAAVPPPPPLPLPTTAAVTSSIVTGQTPPTAAAVIAAAAAAAGGPPPPIGSNLTTISSVVLPPSLVSSSQPQPPTILPPTAAVAVQLPPQNATTVSSVNSSAVVAAAGGGHLNSNSGPGTPPTQGGANAAATNQQQPVEFNHAINYVNKIKNRFQGQPDVYKQFLEILHTYQKDQRAIKDGGTPKSLLTESEVYAQVSRLFQNQEDLLAEFSQFLPEATNDNSADALQLSGGGHHHGGSGKSLADNVINASGKPHHPNQRSISTKQPILPPGTGGLLGGPPPHLPPNAKTPLSSHQLSGGALNSTNDHYHLNNSSRNSQHPSSLASPLITASGGVPNAASASLPSQPPLGSTPPGIGGINDLKRPVSQQQQTPPSSGGVGGPVKSSGGANNNMQPPTKKPRLVGVLKDVSLAEAGKFGTLNEYAFFDKVRKALNSAEVYENFLRCLVLFNQEVVSRSELVQLVNPFLNKNPELLKWFKDFVGFKDGGGGREFGGMPPSHHATPLDHHGHANSAPTPTLSHPRPHERLLPGDTAMEIDYASCKRLGASYCALPKNFVQPKCTGRGVGNTLCREVLNDTWVSFPSWSEDSQFVSSRKTQYEENIYRTEDERFEFDVVLETNRDTIKVLECVQKKMSRMPPEEAARYRLDDCLGGTSPTIHQRAVRRIYGDKAADIIDGLKRNPVVAVPLVLRRLKAKDAEWREVQKQFNKIWRDQNEKYYLKSLDHQGIIFKQNDVRFIRSKSLLNEIETLYDEAHEAEEQSGQPSQGPHITLQYKDKAMLEDASQLLIHHVKRQTSIHKADKQKIKTFLRQHVPDIFYHTRLDMSEEEDLSEDEEGGESSGDQEDKDTKEGKDKDKSKLADLTVKEDEVQDILKENKTPPHIKGLSPGEEYSMLLGNNHLYLFFRLHSILTERLAKIYDQAVIIAAEEGGENGSTEGGSGGGKKKVESTAAALRLKPKNGLSATDYYPAFLDLVRSLLDGNMENQAYEDTLREMFGIHAFTAFTLDKVIGNAVRQLQNIASDSTCRDCLDLYLEERKAGAAGGPVSLAAQRYYNELVYQKKSEKLLTDENCFKMIFYRESGKVTIELLDTDSETREGSEAEGDGKTADGGGKDGGDDSSRQSSHAYLADFLSTTGGGGGGMKISDEARAHLNLKPVFLRRSVRQYRKRNRHKLVPRPAAQQQAPPPSGAAGDAAASDATTTTEATKTTVTLNNDTSSTGEKSEERPETNNKDSSSNAVKDNDDDATAATATKTPPKSAAVSRLGLDDESIMVMEEKSACSLQQEENNRLRIVWVVNSENYIYKRNSLFRARKTHPDVCKRKYAKFKAWHAEWATTNVPTAASAVMADWFAGKADGLAPNSTTRLTINADVKKIPPYRTFTKFKAEMLTKSPPTSQSGGNAAS